MKKITKSLFVTACLAAFCLFASPTQAERPVKIDCRQSPVRQSYPIENFNAISVSSIFEVQLIPSDRESVEIVMNPGYADGVNVTKQGGTLVLGLRGSFTRKGSSDGNCGIKAYVHFKTLNGIKASGATEIILNGVYDMKNSPNMNIQLSGVSEFTGCMTHITNMNIQLSGASEMKLDLNEASSVKCKSSGAAEVHGSWQNIAQTILELSGATEINLSGNGDSMNFTGSGASDASLGRFSVKNFSGAVSGSSELKLNVTESFSGTASGAAVMEISGSPSVHTMSTSGSGEIRLP